MSSKPRSNLGQNMWTSIVTIILVLITISGWLFLKKDPDRYIHEKSSPINFFFKWGRLYHHFFKVAIIIYRFIERKRIIG